MQDWVRARLADLAAAGLLRDPADSELRTGAPAPSGGPWLDACSNDYLGLGTSAVSRETLASLEAAHPGAGAARLVQGTCPEHLELEANLADWLGTEASLLTTSAFAANVGLLPAMVEPDSLIVSDALNHASIVDGCRLARARVVVTPHLDLGAVEAALSVRSGTAPAWVVTEGLFSMDGDSPDLVGLRALCDRFGAGLVLDEAHSLGVLGPSGAGLAAELGVPVEVLVAGLGKAVGSQGGVIACSRDLRVWLWNRARPFVFSTAPSPLLCRVTLAQMKRARTADVARAQLLARSAELRAALVARGLADLSGSSGTSGPIVPVLLGSNDRAMRAMNELRRRGILAQAIRPPTVPLGSARLRLTVHANWPDDAVPRLIEALEVACGS
ncbi:MAG TPA: 8-amino-7-oxononanoate synthase [Polyangiaceae bacterium]|nr:8-amino-7-oxononanoate synthase [Polyangiaceae bacterium]